jgi:acetylornithine deacetylase/succinyl-diaminopimelate desuccinylase-like protein
MVTDALAGVHGYAKSVRRSFERQLARLVEIPTVSMDPARKPDIARGVSAALEILRSHGATAEALETAGNPIVIGSFESRPADPTLTIYNHMDVQPADGPEWRRPPFSLAIEKDRYYGRGATDDKGPALAALFAAEFAARQKLPINLRFLWEFEEEIGSPSFERCLEKHRRALATDSVVVSDTIWIARNKPALSTGLRGLQGAILRLRTGDREVHSGLTGGAARNPLAELSALLSELQDAATGRVKIPGFYGDVVPATKAELQSFRRSGFSVASFKKAHGFRSLRSRDASASMRAIWALPTLEIHGIAGGYQGPGIKTIVPPFAEAKLSMRLVPDQTPAKAFRLLRDHVKKLNPDVEVHAESALSPFRGVTDGPFAEAASEAVHFGFGKRPALVREGGSIGAVVSMQRVLACPVLFIGLSLPEHGYHGPNEFFDFGQAFGGIKTFVRYFELLSRMR